MPARQLLHHITRLDTAVDAHVRQHQQHPALRTLAWTGSRLGDAGVCIMCILWLTGDRRRGTLRTCYLITHTLIVNYAVKRLFTRKRPDGLDGHTSAFPSGHAATGAFAAMLHGSHSPTLLAGASLTAAARVAGRRHWTSDVIAGLALGTTTGAILRRAIR